MGGADKYGLSFFMVLTELQVVPQNVNYAIFVVGSHWSCEINPENIQSKSQACRCPYGQHSKLSFVYLQETPNFKYWLSKAHYRLPASKTVMLLNFQTSVSVQKLYWKRNRTGTGMEVTLNLILSRCLILSSIAFLFFFFFFPPVKIDVWNNFSVLSMCLYWKPCSLGKKPELLNK